MTTAVAALNRAQGKLRLDRDDLTVRWLLVGFALFFMIALLIPLYMMISRSFFDRKGNFTGLANYREYFDTPALFLSIQNSFTVASISTAIVIVLAFAYAYALNRTCMRFKGFFKVIAMVPLLSPSLLKAIALVYWFGKQGILTDLLFGHSIYGPIGIVMASVFWTFPHAVLIIGTALALSDIRLYEAAEVLKTGPTRVFRTITLPGARYGIISAVIVVFILILTDFGVPKVIGGSYNVLATDIYKEVIGQQNFEMGAVVSVILLIPAVIAFAIDRIVTRKSVAQLSSRAVPYAPKPNWLVDNAMLVYCLAITVLTLAILGMAQYAALVKFWPYNLELTLDHYSFEVEGAGWEKLLQLPEGRRQRRPSRHVRDLHRRLPGGEAPPGFRRAPGHPDDGAPAHGGAGPGAGPGLPDVHQSPVESARLPLRHDHDHRDQHHHALLYRDAPDGGDRAQADGPRVRGRLRLVESAAGKELPARHDAGVHAGHLRYLDLPVPELHDDRFRGDLPLRAGHQGRLRRRHPPGRFRRDGGGRRHGDADRLCLRRRAGPACHRHRAAAIPSAGLAPTIERMVL